MASSDIFKNGKHTQHSHLLVNASHSFVLLQLTTSTPHRSIVYNETEHEALIYREHLHLMKEKLINDIC